jgi:hypothetical protein
MGNTRQRVIICVCLFASFFVVYSLFFMNAKEADSTTDHGTHLMGAPVSVDSSTMDYGNPEAMDQYPSHGNHDISQTIENPNIHGRWAPIPLEPTRIPENWTGLPISVHNPLYKDNTSEQSKAHMEAMLREFEEHFSSQASYLKSTTDTYAPLIGWNGIYDVMERWHELTRAGEVKANMAAALHTLGELIAAYTPRYRYAVEVTSRDMLVNSPLHGIIWSAIIATMDPTDTESLFHFIDSELCYFKDVPGKNHLWLSCIHGVGHGLAMLHGSNVTNALAVCNFRSHENDWAYDCASGLYMEILKGLPKKTFSPCDELPYPAVCFRNKIEAFRAAAQQGITFPCSYQTNEYHRRGCIFSEASNEERVAKEPIKTAKKFCAKYLPYLESLDESVGMGHYAACVEGFYTGKLLSAKLLGEDKKPLPGECESFDFDFANEICLRFSSEVGENSRWNVDLLEQLQPDQYLPSALVLDNPRPARTKNKM